MTSVISPNGINSLCEIDHSGSTYRDQPEIIEGVVSPRSQSGSPAAAGQCKIHYLEFSVWRKLGQPLVRHDLTLLRPVAIGERYFGDYPAYSCKKVVAILTPDETRGIITEELTARESEDEELMSYAESLRVPIEVATERWGKLAFDRAHDHWAGSAKWGKREIELYLKSPAGASPEKVIAAGETLWANEILWARAAKDKIVHDLLALKNSSWLNDGEAPMQEATFRKKIQLESITLWGTGKFVLWYKCGSIFSGHAIMLEGDLAKGLGEAEIAG